MSRVILAKSAGFCFGVSRSVELAEGQLALGPCKCLGPLIHNQDVVDRLAARGMAVISSPEEAAAGERVLIRSHGAPKAYISTKFMLSSLLGGSFPSALSFSI